MERRRRIVVISTIIIVLGLIAFIFLPIVNVTSGNPRMNGVSVTIYASASYVLLCAGTEYFSPIGSYIWWECRTS